MFMLVRRMESTSLGYCLGLGFLDGRDLRSIWLSYSLESAARNCFMISIYSPFSSTNVMLTIPVVDFMLLSPIQQNFLNLSIMLMKLLPIVY